MAGKEPETGPTARAVADNVRRIRTSLRLNYTEMSEILQNEAGWSINAVGIRRIESGERRVTPDDLAALSVALKVSPITLLTPGYDRLDRNDLVEVTGRPEAVRAEDLWRWLRAEQPITHSQDGDMSEFYAFAAEALPRWMRVRREKLWGEKMRQAIEDEEYLPVLPEGD